MNNTNILICECGSTEHQIVYSYDEEYNEVDCSIHLSNYNGFLWRLKLAVKYLFGYKCVFGHWDNFHLGEDHIEQLEEIVNMLKNGKTNQRAGN